MELVKDNATGLIWQKCSGGLTNDATCSGTVSTYTWANALTYCNTTLNNLPTSSPKTWRLPSRTELQSIVDYTKEAPTIDVTSCPAYNRWINCNNGFYHIALLYFCIIRYSLKINLQVF